MSTGRERDERKLSRIYGKRDRAIRLHEGRRSNQPRRAKRVRRLMWEYARELQVRYARFEAALASGKTMQEIDA